MGIPKGKETAGFVPLGSSLLAPLGVGCARFPLEALEEFALGLLHRQGGFGIGLDPSEALQLFQCHSRPQGTLAVRRFLEQLERCGPAQIDAAVLPVGLREERRYGAWTMKVEVRV